MHQTLDDLVTLLPQVKILSVHNGGLGGGEKVLDKILTHCEEIGQDVEVLSSSDLIASAKKILVKRKQLQNRSIPTVLFMSGPRDLFLMCVCIFLKIRFACYTQVPYQQAVTFRDPVHYIVVAAYRAIASVASTHRTANSSVSAKFYLNYGNIFLPITLTELLSVRKASFEPANGEYAGFVMVARLNVERGQGSRNLKLLETLVSEIQEYNKTEQKNITFEHIGEISDGIKASILQRCYTIIFHGYEADWSFRRNYDDKIFIYLSNYEGFGLAAFESYVCGHSVVVNSVFPTELLDVCPDIIKIENINSQIIKGLLKSDTFDH